MAVGTGSPATCVAFRREVNMSLVKSPVLTPQKLTANQRNALEKHAMKQAARDRIAKAHMQHGFYSKDGDEALRALGEDPEDFECLRVSLIRDWNPIGSYEELLVRRLARALWRVERADHLQDAMHASQAESMARKLEEQTMAADDRQQLAMAVLERLLECLEQAGACTIEQFQPLQEICGPKPVGRSREILYGAFRLRPAAEETAQALPAATGIPEAGAGEEGSLPPPVGGEEASLTLRAAPSRAEALTIAGGQLQPAQGEERALLRDKVCSLVRQEIKALATAYREEHKRRTAELSPSLLDSLLVPNHPRSDFMQRAEESALRQVERITQLLLKVQEIRKKRQVHNH
jgi:hypothetical protein